MEVGGTGAPLQEQDILSSMSHVRLLKIFNGFHHIHSGVCAIYFTMSRGKGD